MRSRVRIGGLAACLGLIMAACTGVGDDPAAPSADQPILSTGTSAPDAALTLIADADPAAAAISASRALYDSADAVVLVHAGDQAGLTLGASAAVAVGVPLLL